MFPPPATPEKANDGGRNPPRQNFQDKNVFEGMPVGPMMGQGIFELSYC